MKLLFHIYDRRIGEGCFHVVGKKLYYYATKFTGFGDHDISDIVRYEVNDKMSYYNFQKVISHDEAKKNVMDVSICDDKLFYLRKNSLQDCQIRYYNLKDGMPEGDSVGDSELVRGGGYFPMINDSVRKLESGRILCPTAVHHWGPRFMHSSVVVMYSDDGVTWHQSNVLRPPLWLSAGYQEPVVEDLGDGRVMMCMRSSDGWLHSSVSWDNGKTWCHPKRWVRSPQASVCLKKIKDGYLMIGNQRLNPINGAKLGDIRTPLYMTKFNSDFQVVSDTVLESSIYGFYCYPSIYQHNGHIYLAYYTGTKPFHELKISVL